jgi:hypothetical protein
MEGSLLRLHILSQSINKRGRHRQFLFLIGRFLEIDQSEAKMSYGGHVCQWIGTK